MNATKKLTLAMLLALVSSNALALGLGQLKVKSGLNEPLLAVIPVLSDDPAELRGLTAALASPEAFARVGLNFSRLDVPLEFEIVKQADGSTVIQITTDGPVVEPAVGFLLEVNWANGKLLREYSVLLDPPSIAPAVATQRVQPAPASEAAVPRSQPTTAAAPAPKPASTRPITTTESVAAQAAPAPAAAEPTVTEPTSPTPFSSEYKVQAGDTLWGIAMAASADAGVNVNRMMVALQQANPDAFFRNNINALKRGAVMRIPGGDELADVRSAAANAEVQRQNQAWADINAAEPTLVARTGGSNDAPTRRASNPGAADHLQLAAPGESGDGGESRAGVDGGTSRAAVAELKQEIARSKEALASEQQRSGELQTRVQALEDLKNKNSSLLSLKNTEIAELQAQLKKAQAEAEAAEAAAAAAASLAQTPAEAATSASLRDDIFNPETVAVPSSAAVAQATSAADLATVGSAAVAEAASASVAAASTVATDAAAATAETAVSLAAATSVATAPDMASTEAATPTITEPAPQPAPAVVEDQSTPSGAPWYMQTWAWLLGGAALIAILLGALFSSRRSKSAPSSLADDYDEAHADGADHAELTDDEYALLDELEQHPDDLALHLELASFYYALRDQNKFEAAAEAMYSHVDDPPQAEWEQVLAMGEELCPDHPLFAELHTDSDHFDTESDVEDEAEIDIDADTDTDIDTEEFEADDDAPPPSVAADNGDIRRSSERGYNFDFNLTAPTKASPAPVDEEVAPATEFDDEFDSEPSLSELAGDGADGTVDDAGFSTDPVDTKLDLARAYHDMGDTEGARAMLDEVIAEGSQMQQDAARKLLQELD